MRSESSRMSSQWLSCGHINIMILLSVVEFQQCLYSCRRTFLFQDIPFQCHVNFWQKTLRQKHQPEWFSYWCFLFLFYPLGFLLQLWQVCLNCGGVQICHPLGHPQINHSYNPQSRGYQNTDGSRKSADPLELSSSCLTSHMIPLTIQIADTFAFSTPQLWVTDGAIKGVIIATKIY